jgi:hypothetical protein
LTTTIGFSAIQSMARLNFEVNYLTHGGNVLMCAQTTALDGGVDIAEGDGAIEFSFGAVGLQPGVYTVLATVTGPNSEVIDQLRPPFRLTVEAGRNVRGYFFSPHTWRGDEEAVVRQVRR